MLGRWKAVLPNLIGAGLLLATLEIVWVLARAGSLFLSVGERAWFALASAGLATSCVVALGSAIWYACALQRRALRALFALAVGGAAMRLTWLLSEGRRVRDLSARPYVVALCALLAAGFAFALLELRARRGVARSVRSPLALATPLALAILCVDALVLPRGYPAFHLALALLALAVASYAASFAPAAAHPRWVARTPWVGLALLVGGLGASSRLAVHPTAGFAVRETSPWTARFTRLFQPAPQVRALAARAPTMGPARAGVDLRDRDVLLITVDALRADLLRAYGSTRSVAPTIDALAEESAVFTRAYTPAPHTSYALASLLTGKFVKPLVELGQQLGNPATLPDRLRRYGYRTAAFYPPAIFFVDGASFTELQDRGFGFEYRKEQFASAAERVSQLDAYLNEVDPKRSLFVWVHLFEPHEPYDPPADIAHDGSARGRYDAEVRAADRGIAALVERFRRARPKATVIITADHGEEFGDHGGSFHGSSLYDEQVRVPLVWSSPGVVTPRRIDAPVELTDVGTTILSTAGIPRDAHMRGDELGAALAGDVASAPRYAFASIEARHMVSDGAYKLICGARETHCALFDLLHDPGERQNLAGAQAARAATLRGQLDAFLASITRREAVAVSAGVGFPEALARAKLGAAIPLRELLPSLSDARPTVRAEAARVLATMGDAAALPALASARAYDEDEEVRAEAAIAALQLGDAEARAAVLEVHRSGRVARQRRAAQALARAGDASAIPTLATLIADPAASEEERLRALRALAQLGSQDGVPAAIEALSEVRLRAEAATTLGRLGGEAARTALRTQLAEERYPPARRAEAEALRALNDPVLVRLVRHYLGMESSLPQGVRLMAELGALTPPSRAGGLLVDPGSRSGVWRCEGAACAPERDAKLLFPARGPQLAGPVRVTLWFEAGPDAGLRIEGERVALTTGDGQLSFVRARAPRQLAIEAEGQVALRAVVVAPSVPEIPPPPPEPWEADVSVDDAGTSTPVR